MTWTDERVEALRKLWSDGLSASQIAGELGGITRNAVIGKVHRLGLSGRVTALRPRSPQPPRKPRSHVVWARRPEIRETADAAVIDPGDRSEPEPDVNDNAIPLEQRRTLLQIETTACHWPVGDPAHAGFFFCGGKSVEGLPYCAQHSRVAYQPPAERRSRRPAYHYRTT